MRQCFKAAQTRPGTQQALSGYKHIQLCIPHIMTQWFTISVRWGGEGQRPERLVIKKKKWEKRKYRVLETDSEVTVSGRYRQTNTLGFEIGLQSNLTFLFLNSPLKYRIINSIFALQC